MSSPTVPSFSLTCRHTDSDDTISIGSSTVGTDFFHKNPTIKIMNSDIDTNIGNNEWAVIVRSLPKTNLMYLTHSP